MTPAWSADFLDMLHALVEADVEFMIVGGSDSCPEPDQDCVQLPNENVGLCSFPS